MTWRLARSLEVLREQINAAYPDRSKVSDGTIGDTAHSARKSDHNPEGDGTVDALDITHDPVNGPDIADMATALISSRDPRIKYIIANGEIIAGRQGPSPWKRRKYNGANKHSRHIHVSVLDEGQDDTRAWQIGRGAASSKPVEPKQSILKRGSKGPFVTDLQQNLRALGHDVGTADGVFGAKTEVAVKAFQNSRGLSVDGWAGPRTIEAIGKALAEKATKPKIEMAREVTKDQAAKEVEKKTSRWQWLTGLFSSGALGLGWLAGMEWQAIVAIGGVVLLFLIVILIMRRQIVGAVKEIREGLG